MVEVTVKIPEEMKEIADEAGETIYVETLKEVARKRMSSSQKRLKELKEQITIYEKNYNKSFEDFSRDVPDTFDGHEDWIEWSYLVHAANELENKLEKLDILLG